MALIRRFLNRCLRSKIERFALVALWTLVLGVSATAATSAFPGWLSGQRSQQLFSLGVPTGPPHGASSTGGDTMSFSLPVFEALRGDRRIFSDVMAYAPLGDDKVAVEKDGVSEEATGEMVSGNFFSGLGVKMRTGGGFKMEDERRHMPAVVLSFAYWTHLYSRDPDVPGRTIYIQGIPFAVLGVTAEGFTGVEPGRATDFWIPLQSRPELNPWGRSQMLDRSPNWWCLRLMARLAPGMDAQRAVAEATPEFQAAAYAGMGTGEAVDPKMEIASRRLGWWW
jgi:MacB-like periplasmic core domain